MIWKSLIVLMLGGLLIQSCQSPTTARYSTDDKVNDVLTRALNSAGGLDRYQSLDSIVYRKRSVLYHADGSVESDQYQLHAYALRPALSGEISWTDSLGDHGIHYDNPSTYKSLNGEKIPNSEESARKSFLSSHFVLMMPYKLIDPGVTLTYDGTTTIDSMTVDVLKAEYNPTDNENHSTSDVWWGYFEQGSGEFVASMVYHHPTYAYIENTIRETVGPMKQNLRRHSWRTDSLRNKQFLRAEFWYEDFKYPVVE